MDEKIEYLYFYNIEQSSFYMQHGVNAVDCGINEKTKMVWHKFIKRETTYVYQLWLEQCRIYKEDLKRKGE